MVSGVSSVTLLLLGLLGAVARAETGGPSHHQARRHGHSDQPQQTPSEHIKIAATNRHHHRGHGSSGLMRKEELAGEKRGGLARKALVIDASGSTSADLLPWLEDEAEMTGPSLASPPIFKPRLHACDQAQTILYQKNHSDRASAATMDRQWNNMRGLVEAKEVFAQLDIPVILLSGLLLGWRRNCMATPGDPDADVATFGPWLADVGLDRIGEAFERRGHVLSTDMCKDGPLTAGCELRVTFDGLSKKERELGGRPYIDVFVLFSAPPPGAGRLPGLFNRCDVEMCGGQCELCRLGYSTWYGPDQQQGRFFACPVPLGKFELAIFMNQTFWVPANIEQYLEAEYGPGWAAPESDFKEFRPCSPYMDSDISFSPYPSYVPGLEEGQKVLSLQKKAERKHREDISQAAVFERELWKDPAAQIHEPGETVQKDPSKEAPWKFPRDPPSARKRIAEAVESASHAFVTRAKDKFPFEAEKTIWALNLVAVMVAGWALYSRIGEGSGSAMATGGPALRRSALFGLETKLQAFVFVAYVFFSCSHMFLQHRAGSTGYSVVSATILLYFMKFAVAFGMFLYKGGAVSEGCSLLLKRSTAQFGRVPNVLLPMIPGGLLAGYDMLSFVSLAELDPVTYQVFLHVRLVFIVLLWQTTFQRQLSRLQWLAMILFVMASTEKGFDRLQVTSGTAGKGLLIAVAQIALAVGGNVASELLLKELTIPTDLLNACQYFQGLLVLMVGTILTHGRHKIVAELLAPAAWMKLGADPWMVLSILCMVAFGIVTAYFLRELSNMLKELSACFVIVLAALVEWGVLGSSRVTALGAQAVVLAILALVVYNREPLQNRPAKAQEQETNAKASSAAGARQVSFPTPTALQSSSVRWLEWHSRDILDFRKQPVMAQGPKVKNTTKQENATTPN